MKLNNVYMCNYNFTDEKKGDPEWQNRFGYFAVLSEDNDLSEQYCKMDEDKFNELVKKELGVKDDDIVFYAEFPAAPTEAAFKREMLKENIIIHSVVEGE